ncbi:MAG: helix-turn-helix transcriptional regulator [Timaviella obliquedivisa GSE-PSE-MK23-08B]|jgi:DNA-binding Xre family transcriptional regulator|nr:helix-turn-helix transcriptional regulator [Timaviella obliquedivisa GSE-PSE-MK23-08B]
MQDSYPQRLRSLLQQAHIPSLKALSHAANVSEWQVRQLRRGQVAKMRVESLHKLAQALQVSMVELVEKFSELAIATPTDSNFQQEYQRLQLQLQQQRESLQQEFQNTSLQILESWLIQYPTAAYAAQQKDVSASRLLPLMRPIEQLIEAWGLAAIAPVGAEVDYDPQLHQLMEGHAEVGDRVKVRYTGYRQGEKLLYRAKVSPVKPAEN